MSFRFAYAGVQVRDLERSLAFDCGSLGIWIRRRETVPETGGERAELESPESPCSSS